MLDRLGRSEINENGVELDEPPGASTERLRGRRWAKRRLAVHHELGDDPPDRRVADEEPSARNKGPS
jgi:hypothetical protein